METLERRIRMVSSAAIALILFVAYWYVDTRIERALELPNPPAALSSLRANVMATTMIAAFLMMLINSISIRLIVRAAKIQQP